MASIKDTLPQAERDHLIALFNAGRNAELEGKARALTKRYPYSGFVWKVQGVALQLLGKDALPALKKAAELLPEDAEAHSNLGVAQNARGRYRDAAASFRRALQIRPDFAEAHSNLGNALQDLEQLDDAVASYRRALELRPDSGELHCNLGNVLHACGQHDEAAASCRRALDLQPHYVDAHINLGNALNALGRLDEAVASYRRAIEIKPDSAEAHSNLGNALNDLGRLDEAVASYSRALEIKPDYAEACSNLGNALQDLGRLDEAVASCRRALQINPGYAKAHENLALLLIARGEPMPALDAIQHALRLKETSEAKSIFVSCVKHLRLAQSDSGVRATMVRALTELWGRPSDLAGFAIDLVKLDAEVGACVARAAGAWPQRLSSQALFGANGLAALGSDSLLIAVLDSVPVCDIAMEHFLTMARSAMLEAATAMPATENKAYPPLGFHSALARQCFTNEYVFSCTDDEVRIASELKDSLNAALEAGASVPALWLAAVAAYFPLHTLPSAARLLDISWPEDIETLLMQQILEPGEERRIRPTITRLGEISDEVSLLVRDQYEDNPYPRWIRLHTAGKPVTVSRYLCQAFPLAPAGSLTGCDAPEILVAGCGTGRHAIETARRFQGARVLAVDLSLSSLSYATRKTRELGLNSIEYARADLLQLGSLGRSFDLIESVGVLHHLADPWAGWRVLLSLLRPGGHMRLGFYSEVARRNIVRARVYIAAQGYGSSATEIRRSRQALIELDKAEDLGTTLKASDFFSTSACRDLLFHVQEHRMTLTGIDAFLRENGLLFMGFDIGADVLHAYRRRFPADPAATDLTQWQIFENENPDIFIGMYQFWIHKPG